MSEYIISNGYVYCYLKLVAFTVTTTHVLPCITSVVVLRVTYAAGGEYFASILRSLMSYFRFVSDLVQRPFNNSWSRGRLYLEEEILLHLFPFLLLSLRCNALLASHLLRHSATPKLGLTFTRE